MADLLCVCTETICSTHTGTRCLRPLTEQKFAKYKDKKSGGLICDDCYRRIEATPVNGASPLAHGAGYHAGLFLVPRLATTRVTGADVPPWTPWARLVTRTFGS
jgi:hypothetical protein